MSASVQQHQVAPTFDITGLSEYQIAVIKKLVGMVSSESVPIAELYSALYEGVPSYVPSADLLLATMALGSGQRYRVNALYFEE